MQATSRSSGWGPLREGWADFRKNWWRGISIFALPIIGLSLILFLGMSTSYLSLIMVPVMLPFLYCAYRFFWTSRDSKRTFGINYTDYGVRGNGCFGFLNSSLIGALVTVFIYYILAVTITPALMKLFGGGAYVQQIEDLIKSSNIQDLFSLLNDSSFQVALSKPLTIINGISLYVGGSIMLILLDMRRAEYVAGFRILPDADVNIPGSMIRSIGKSFTRGLYWERIKLKAPVAIPAFLLLSVLYAGFVAAFCFVDIPLATIAGSLPVLCLAPFLIISYAVDASFDVPVIDSLMKAYYSAATQEMKDGIVKTFYNTQYRHTSERFGQVPFQGVIPSFDQSQSDNSNIFTVDAEDIKTETKPTDPVDHGASASTTPEDTQGSSKEKEAARPAEPASRNYGVLDFSALDDQNHKTGSGDGNDGGGNAHGSQE